MSTFDVTYLLTVQEEKELDGKIEGICLEQSVELPREVVSAKIFDSIVGKPVEQEQISDNIYRVTIRWPTAILGGEIISFLNLLYGNISLKPGIRIAEVEWSALFPQILQGPSFGIQEIRNKHNINNRPLSATALKPMGLSVSQLADLCYRFACGGIDIIKDDHGLANQAFAPFEQRVEACVQAVRKAADKTGQRSKYYSNITAEGMETVNRYKQAANMGADGVLICPHLCGLSTMHRLAQLDINLPIIAHPAFSGSLIQSTSQGMEPDFLYGELWRALGADFVIYPNQDGRFTFTLDICKVVNAAARDSDLPFNKAFPMPAGGIQMRNMDRWLEEYDSDTAYLIGGSLYEHPDGIEQAARTFQNKLQQGLQ